MFGLAGTGVRGRLQVQPVAGEPTALAVGGAIDALYSALPAEQRHAARDLPAVVRQLEAQALALRAGEAHAVAEQRMESVVSALESVRLELLRLHAGSGSLDGLTRDLDAARQIGHEVDAAIEVRALLRPPSTAPPIASASAAQRTPA
jgi:serine/threonine-protein kinase